MLGWVLGSAFAAVFGLFMIARVGSRLLTLMLGDNVRVGSSRYAGGGRVRRAVDLLHGDAAALRDHERHFVRVPRTLQDAQIEESDSEFDGGVDGDVGKAGLAGIRQRRRDYGERGPASARRADAYVERLAVQGRTHVVRVHGVETDVFAIRAGTTLATRQLAESDVQEEDVQDEEQDVHVEDAEDPYLSRLARRAYRHATVMYSLGSVQRGDVEGEARLLGGFMDQLEQVGGETGETSDESDESDDSDEDEDGWEWVRHPRWTRGEPRYALVVVPGNPGLSDFYGPYLRSVYEATGGFVDVFCVAHAGHCPASHDEESASKGRVFNLQQQVVHKVAFVQQLLRADPDLHVFLAGHSVGAHICLEVLRRLSPYQQERVAGVFHLFPTIMHIGATPNGKALTWLFQDVPRRLIASAAVCMRLLLPKFVLRKVLQWHLREYGDTSGSAQQHSDSELSHVLDAALQLFEYPLVSNALYMAKHEMAEIHDMDADFIREHLHKMVFYFGRDDRWCPDEFAARIIDEFPDAHYEVDDDGVRHAFVIGGSELMGRKTAEWMKQRMW